LEKKGCPLEENLCFHKYFGQIYLYQNLPHFGGRWPVKAEPTNFCSPPMTLLESLVCSTPYPSTSVLYRKGTLCKLEDAHRIFHQIEGLWNYVCELSSFIIIFYVATLAFSGIWKEKEKEKKANRP
jgi:hypothetical protein